MLLAAGATFGLFGLPFASTPEKVAGSEIFADGLYNIMDNPALIGLFSAGGLLTFISIFLFNNRPLQMRMTIFAFTFNLIGIVLGVIFFMQNSAAIGEETPVNDGSGLYAIGAALILLLVAYRFINKDEKLVRSMDRLR